MSTRFNRQTNGCRSSSSRLRSSPCSTSSGAASVRRTEFPQHPMSSGLFRAQVRAHAESAWLGTILLVQPASFALLAACAFAIAVAMGAFLAFGEHTRKARLDGIVAPENGVVRIVAPQAGIVESVRVA